MAIELISILNYRLECGNCADVIIEISAPEKLAANEGIIDQYRLQTYLKAQILSYTLVADECGNKYYQYTFRYDEAQLLDSQNRVDECDIIRICCADCLVKYIDQQFIDESTVGALVDNSDGTFTYDNGLGDLTNFNARSTLIDNGDGTFTYTDEAGVVTIFNALSIVLDNGDNSFTYTDEIGANVVISFEHTLSQPVPNLVRLTKPDGTQDDITVVGVLTTLVDNLDNSFTYTSEDFSITTVNFDYTLTEPVPNTVRLTKPDGTFDDVVVSFSETITTLVDNTNNTFTYSSEDLTVTVINFAHVLTQPVAGTVRLTRPDGTFDELVLTPIVETVTTLVDNGDNTFTYTSEDATVTNFDSAHTLSSPAESTLRLTRPDTTFDTVSLTSTLRITRSPAESDNNGSGVSFNLRIQNMGATGTSTSRYVIQVPANWDTSQSPTVRARLIHDAADGNVRHEWGVAYFAPGEALDSVDDQTITFTHVVVGGTDVYYETAAQSLNKALISPGDLMRLAFRRLGGDAADTQSGAVQLFEVSIEFPLLTLRTTT